MPQIFISYRRDDSSAITGRIYDRFVAAFGRDSVFRDVYSIPLGEDFRAVLHRAVSSCDILLVVIGSQWLNITDEKGQRRLDNPNDFVRIEVETGLNRAELRVIPLLYKIPMPNERELPPSLRDLAFKNAFTIHDDPDFHPNLDRLIGKILEATSPTIQMPSQISVTKEGVPVLPSGEAVATSSVVSQALSSEFCLVVRRGPKVNQVYRLDKDTLTLGRDITNDITINDREMSRNHIRLTRAASGFTLEDLGSTNGTFVNGRRLTGAKLLNNGDLIGLGETVTLSYELARTSVQVFGNAVVLPLPPVGSFRLSVRRGPQPNQVYELNKDVLTIGRDLTNDIPINDNEVSRHHIRLTRDSGGFTLEDLGSTNGTFVNGKRLTDAKPLNNGDLIGLGETITLAYEIVRP